MTLKGKSLTREILFMVAVGPVLLSALFAPNAVQILKPLIKWRKNWDKIDRRRIHEAIKRLNQKRLVELIERGGGLYIKITTNGKQLIRNFDYDNLELPQSKMWDKKWRLVVFDIPDNKNKERRALSKKLKDLGLFGSYIGKEQRWEWMLAEVTVYLLQKDLKFLWPNSKNELYPETRGVYKKVKDIWKNESFENYLIKSYNIIKDGR